MQPRSVVYTLIAAMPVAAVVYAPHLEAEAQDQVGCQEYDPHYTGPENPEEESQDPALVNCKTGTCTEAVFIDALGGDSTEWNAIRDCLWDDKYGWDYATPIVMLECDPYNIEGCAFSLETTTVVEAINYCDCSDADYAAEDCDTCLDQETVSKEEACDFCCGYVPQAGQAQPGAEDLEEYLEWVVEFVCEAEPVDFEFFSFCEEDNATVSDSIDCEYDRDCEDGEGIVVVDQTYIDNNGSRHDPSLHPQGVSLDNSRSASHIDIEELGQRILTILRIEGEMDAYVDKYGQTMMKFTLRPEGWDVEEYNFMTHMYEVIHTFEDPECMLRVPVEWTGDNFVTVPREKGENREMWCTGIWDGEQLPPDWHVVLPVTGTIKGSYNEDTGGYVKYAYASKYGTVNVNLNLKPKKAKKP